jgi:hypothetical protein
VIDAEYRRSEFLFYGAFPELAEIYRRLHQTTHAGELAAANGI